MLEVAAVARWTRGIDVEQSWSCQLSKMVGTVELTVRFLLKV